MRHPFHVFFGEMDLGEVDVSSRAAEGRLRFEDISGVLEKKGKELKEGRLTFEGGSELMLRAQSRRNLDVLMA